MLTLLLLLVLNHSVMAVGADRDDADVGFDLGYAILLGGLFVLLNYQLIPRRQRKISYEEQEGFRGRKSKTSCPQKSAEGGHRISMKIFHRPEHIEALLSMFQLMALDRSNVKHWYPASVLQLVFDEDTGR
ncbi:unnamed protein product, partial [Mesorhabditis spiculigera]